MHLFVKHETEAMEKYMKVNPYVGEKYFTRFEATTGALSSPQQMPILH